MPVKYALFENHMTPDPNDRMAITVSDYQYTQEDVINQMVSRGSTVTKAEAFSVMEEYALAVEQMVLEGGGTIVTPLFNISISIIGVFTDENDSFDPARHQVKIRVVTGKRLRQIEGSIKTQKIAAEKKIPVLLNFFDNNSDTRNEVLTPGSGGRITGVLLKFDEADPTQGIFFIKGDGTVTKMPEKPLKNKPSELIFVTPSLARGEYTVEVRAGFTTKEVRVGKLPYILTVS